LKLFLDSLLEKKVYTNEEDISIVFKHLKQFIAQPKTRKERIGSKKRMVKILFNQQNCQLLKT